MEQGAGGELEALALEGGGEETPQHQQQQQQQQPSLLPGRRLAAAAVAATALVAFGLVAYFSSTGAVGPFAAPPPPAAAATGDSQGEQPGTVGLFGEYGTYGGCQCDCTWASSPNACIPQANDGGCCWSTCCRGAGGSTYPDSNYVVVHSHGPVHHVHTDGYYPGSDYPDSTHVVVHHHYGSRYYHYHPNSTGQPLWLYVIIGFLTFAACIGLYYYCCTRKPWLRP